MKVKQSQVTKLQITDVEHLDSLHVFIEDLGPRSGKITMETSSESWSAYWGGCGSKGVIAFFKSCNNSYLVNCFSRGISSTITDYDNLDEWFKNKICKDRRMGEYSHDKALSLWNSVELWCCNDESFLHSDRGRELANDIIGDDWHFDLPKCDNGEYLYLVTIVQAMSEAFSQLNIEEAA